MQWITRYGNAYDNANIAWDFCSFPAFPTHKVGTGATGYVVYNRTRNPDTAAALALVLPYRRRADSISQHKRGKCSASEITFRGKFLENAGTDWSDKNFDAFVSYPDASTPATVIIQSALRDCRDSL